MIKNKKIRTLFIFCYFLIISNIFFHISITCAQKNNFNDFLNIWNEASVKSIKSLKDSLITPLNNNSSYIECLNDAEISYKKYRLSMRMLLIDTLFKQYGDSFFNNLYSDNFIIIERNNNINCTTYFVDILKIHENNYSGFKFRIECANRSLDTIKYNLSFKSEIVNFINSFEFKGNCIYDTNCMITFINKDNFTCYPLLYLTDKKESELQNLLKHR